MRLGVREIVPLALLLVALGIGFIYLDPAASSGGDEGKREVERGTSLTTPTPDPDAKAEWLPAPEKWDVIFASRSPAGDVSIAGRGTETALNFDFASPPFPELRDNAWFLMAEANYAELPPGKYALEFSFEGQVRVFIGREDTGQTNSGGREAEVRRVFDHAGGPLIIRIDAQDVGDRVMLKSK